MKFFGRSGKIEEEQEDKTVLFVCVENSGRSQIAEAFFREYAPKGYSAFSAGTKPSPEVNPLAIEVMREYAIDISKQRPKIITEDMIICAEIRVNMGCMDRNSCPTLFIHNLIEWALKIQKVNLLKK